MISTLVIALFALLFSQPLFFIGVKLANTYGLLDHPSPRRRHRTPTPIIGGVIIFVTWFFAILLYSFFHPNWLVTNLPSLLPMSTGLFILIMLGLVDDVRGLTPKTKLFFQVVAAAVMIQFDPRLHSLALYWRETVGFLIWPLSLIWIVGMTNAVNLIDGLDGLAGGTSFIVSSSIVILSLISDGPGTFQGVSMIMLAAGILGFLRFNWSPAKMFLGDNGSLPLGFMIAVNSLTCHPPTRSWIMISSVILMMGYPILDMGLAVSRRFFYGLALFKADRNHLHFRVQRLGLTVPQTAIFLLSVSLYLQVTALTLNLLPISAVLPSLAMVLFSVFGLLYVVRCIERSKINQINVLRTKIDFLPLTDVMNLTHPNFVHIPLSPILEVGLFEENSRCLELIKALETMLRSTAAKDEKIIVSHEFIRIMYSISVHDLDQDQLTKKKIELRYRKKLDSFCAMMELQCSTSEIPVILGKIA